MLYTKKRPPVFQLEIIVKEQVIASHIDYKKIWPLVLLSCQSISLSPYCYASSIMWTENDAGECCVN